MAGISRYEKVILLATAAFLLLCGGWTLLRQTRAPAYVVTVAERSQTQTAAQSGPDTPDSLLPGEKIDLNTAPAGDLERLPGIGEKRAADIVAYRQANGPFRTIEDIKLVSGIGEATLEELRDYITVTDQEG